MIHVTLQARCKNTYHWYRLKEGATGVDNSAMRMWRAEASSYPPHLQLRCPREGAVNSITMLRIAKHASGVAEAPIQYAKEEGVGCSNLRNPYVARMSKARSRPSNLCPGGTVQCRISRKFEVRRGEDVLNPHLQLHGTLITSRLECSKEDSCGLIGWLDNLVQNRHSSEVSLKVQISLSCNVRRVGLYVIWIWALFGLSALHLFARCTLWRPSPPPSESSLTIAPHRIHCLKDAKNIAICKTQCP